MYPSMLVLRRLLSSARRLWQYRLNPPSLAHASFQAHGLDLFRGKDEEEDPCADVPDSAHRQEEVKLLPTLPSELQVGTVPTTPPHLSSLSIQLRVQKTSIEHRPPFYSSWSPSRPFFSPSCTLSHSLTSSSFPPSCRSPLPNPLTIPYAFIHNVIPVFHSNSNANLGSPTSPTSHPHLRAAILRRPPPLGSPLLQYPPRDPLLRSRPRRCPPC